MVARRWKNSKHGTRMRSTLAAIRPKGIRRTARFEESARKRARHVSVAWGNAVNVRARIRIASNCGGGWLGRLRARARKWSGGRSGTARCNPLRSCKRARKLDPRIARNGHRPPATCKKKRGRDFKTLRSNGGGRDPDSISDFNGSDLSSPLRNHNSGK